MIFCQGNVREMSGNFEPTQMWQPCPRLRASSPACKRLLRFTSGAIPADILAASMAAGCVPCMHVGRSKINHKNF